VLDPLAWGLGLSAAGWAGAGAAGLLGLARVPLLPPLADPPPPALRVSVVIPARDEAERIEGTLRRLLAQRSVELEIVVVDDRSRDATAAIVERVAREDARVRLVRVAELPPGWLGKTHACERGARASSGAWILFTDGDIHLAPDVLARALAHAANTKADHVVLGPAIDGQTFCARAATAAFGATMLPLLAAANSDSKRAGIGIGAFNLVRRSAWEAVGGHEQLRLEVVDDICLGKLLARGGYRTRACFAGHDVVADWARRLRDVPRALEKNMFAQMDYSLAKALVFSLGALLFWLAPFVGLAAGLFDSGWTARLGWLAFAAMFCTVPASIAGARVTGAGLLPALCSPLFFFALPWAMLNSTFVTLARGGVLWRDTFHPLSELRAAKVR
jgi:glycosyltransferase involved in cell wall biosynthesis